MPDPHTPNQKIIKMTIKNEERKIPKCDEGEIWQP